MVFMFQMTEEEMYDWKSQIVISNSIYNDINEDTRMLLQLINDTLTELQIMNRVLNKRHKSIGYLNYKEDPSNQ